MIRSQVVVEGGYVCVVLVTAHDAAVDQRVRTHVLRRGSVGSQHPIGTEIGIR
jgi:hypothetical protein